MPGGSLGGLVDLQMNGVPGLCYGEFRLHPMYSFCAVYGCFLSTQSPHSRGVMQPNGSQLFSGFFNSYHRSPVRKIISLCITLSAILNTPLPQYFLNCKGHSISLRKEETNISKKHPWTSGKCFLNNIKMGL